MTMSSDTPIFNKLTLRMIAPVVLVVCAVGVGFYFFVLRTLSDYAEKEMRASLARTAKEIYDICDGNFTTLLQSGQLGDDKMVRISRALTLGSIEDYAKRHDLRLILRERKQEVLLRVRIDDALSADIAKIHKNGPAWHWRIGSEVYYFHHFDFKPWQWHIDLISDTAPFAPLIDGVKRVYGLTAVVLLLGLSVLIFALDRSLRNPVRRIIAAVREKRPPDYRGIHEFEFLSRNIAGMMTSLKEHTQWLERLYAIGTTHRGEDFFRAIARAMADTMGLDTVITRAEDEGAGFRIVAVAQPEGGCGLALDDLADGLPCELLESRSEPIVVPHGAAERFAEFKGIAACQSDCYIGLAISDRDGRTVGCTHLFGKTREIDDWDMNFIKTASRMAGSEFELMEKERDQERIREQMFRSQKLESLGMLAGGVAHDFNNLLMGIQGRASLALLEGDGGKAVVEHIRAIEEYILRASELTSQLLGFARGGKYDVKPTDINKVLEQSARMFGRTKKEIVVHTDFAPDLGTVEIDRQQIEQVFLNLFVNAWHAMPGGGDLTITTENVFLDETFPELRGNAPGPFAKISVADTGTGMDETTLKKIFDPFFSTREVGKGTGLGLSMVYGIVKNHDGVITVGSKVGQGSTFKVYLPTSDKAPHPPAPRRDRRIVQGAETILLIDDEQMILEVACSMLEKLGYRVVAANGGPQALEAMRRAGEEIDLAILDLIMPGMDGIQVFDRLKEIRPDLPVIASSGYSIDGQAEAIMRRGCNGFIQKPFDMSRLSRKIREVLDGTK